MIRNTTIIHATKAARQGILIACQLLLISLVTATAGASENGRPGFAGNPATNQGATCTVCHTPGAAVPSVSLDGPTEVDAGGAYLFIATISGGPAARAGVGVSAGDGVLRPLGGDMRGGGSDIYHSGPQPFRNGSASFAFEWTAPDSNGQVALYAAGNSANDSDDPLGDGVGTTVFNVTVKNGDGPPPIDPGEETDAITLTPYSSGLARPVAVAHAGDQRLFIAEQPGRIRVTDGAGNPRQRPFLNIAGRVQDSGGEQGLLGLAFDPDYSVNGHFFVYYITSSGGSDKSRVSRFSVSGNPDVAAANSELILLEFAQPFPNHNAGDLHFGRDGYLYIASGDGGGGGDPRNNAQNTGNLLGKLLRIDVDGTSPAADCNQAAGSNYAIPPGNTFNDGAGGAGCDEIFAMGLRNPWRFSFDRDTDDLWIGDVGQNSFEEIDYAPAGSGSGLNFGWRCFEGNNPFNNNGCGGSYEPPLLAVSHRDGNCSITGGYVYRGSLYPGLRGQYLFSDFCNTAIRSVDIDSGSPLVRELLAADNISAPSTFGEDVNGELYVASLRDGVLYRIEAENPNPPVDPPPEALLTASPGSGDAPLTVNFDGSASADDSAIISYRFDFGDGNDSTGAGTAAAYTYADPGEYLAVLTVTDDGGNTDSSNTTITVNDPVVPPGGPQAAFVADQTSGVAPLTVNFDGRASTAAGGVAIYRYDFGDSSGTYNDNPLASHTYDEPGEYNVTLLVFDNAGNTDVASTRISVTDGPTPPGDFEAVLSLSPERGRAPLTVRFDGRGSTSPLPISIFRFDFGDFSGTYSANPVVSHTYTEPGTYFVALQIFDSQGNSAFETASVVVTGN